MKVPMKNPLRSSLVWLFALSTLITASAQARGPTAGLYENSTEAPTIEFIDSARQMLDIEIYTMRDPIVQKAILNALNDNVKVRIIQEPHPIGDGCDVFEESPSTEDLSCAQLKAFRTKVLKAGGTYVPFNKRLCGGQTAGCVEHGKMILVDGNAALLSTGNFDPSSFCDSEGSPTRCNRDYTYILHYLPAVKVLGQIFEHDLAGVPYDLKAILARPGAADLTVSPFSLPPLIQFIRSAKKTLVIQQQYLKDPEMNAAILDAAHRGVLVRINVASACSFAPPSEIEARKWKETYSNFENAGAKIRVFTSSMLVEGVPGYLHAKAIVVDGTTAWVGSVNGSTQALGSNREFGIFFDTPSDIRLLLGFIQSDFKNPAGESWQESLICAKDYP